MKKLITILALSFVFISCESSQNVQEVDEETKIPNSVYQTLIDTSLVMDSKLIPTENEYYVIQEKNDKKAIVKVITKSAGDIPAFWLGVFVTFFLSLFIGSLIFKD